MNWKRSFVEAYSLYSLNKRPELKMQLNWVCKWFKSKKTLFLVKQKLEDFFLSLLMLVGLNMYMLMEIWMIMLWWLAYGVDRVYSNPISTIAIRANWKLEISHKICLRLTMTVCIQDFRVAQAYKWFIALIIDSGNQTVFY